MELQVGDLITLEYDIDHKLGKIINIIKSKNIDSIFDIINVKWTSPNIAFRPFSFYHRGSLKFICRQSKKCKVCKHKLKCITEGE